MRKFDLPASSRVSDNDQASGPSSGRDASVASMAHLSRFRVPSRGRGRPRFPFLIYVDRHGDLRRADTGQRDRYARRVEGEPGLRTPQVPDEHVELVKTVYGPDWDTPYTTLYERAHGRGEGEEEAQPEPET